MIRVHAERLTIMAAKAAGAEQALAEAVRELPGCARMAREADQRATARVRQAARLIKENGL